MRLPWRFSCALAEEKDLTFVYIECEAGFVPPFHYFVNFFFKLFCHICFSHTALCNHQVTGKDTHFFCVFKLHQEIIDIYDKRDNTDPCGRLSLISLIVQHWHWHGFVGSSATNWSIPESEPGYIEGLFF